MHSDSVLSGQTREMKITKITVACLRFRKFRLGDVTLVKVKVSTFIEQVRGPGFML
jgi:hypothetical protein